MSDPQALTWDDVATIYDKRYGGQKARTLPMSRVFDRVASLPQYTVKDGTLFRLEASDAE